MNLNQIKQAIREICETNLNEKQLEEIFELVDLYHKKGYLKGRKDKYFKRPFEDNLTIKR